MKKSKPKHVQALRSLERFDLKSIAKESGWMTRDCGKVTPESFCSSMIAAADSSSASLRTVAFLSGELTSQEVSKQALHGRVNARAVECFETLLGEAMASKAGSALPEPRSGFRRIIVQDSTSIGLPRHLADVLKGGGNASSEAAGLKIHTSFDLVARRFISFEIREQRSPDQGFALEGIEGLGEGDLLLRDLGYFSIGSFRELERSKAHVLTRWRFNVALVDPHGMDTIDVPALLRAGGRIDRRVLAGAQERLPMRLVAFRVPAEVAKKRRRRIRETAKRKGHTPSRDLLILQDWQIYLTTCDRESLSFENVFELYCQRWAIEILFKGFKSHMRIDKIPPRCSEAMARCLVCAALVRIVLATQIASFPTLGQEPGEPGVSLLKVFSLVEVLGFEPSCRYFEDPAKLANFLRHCRYEKRKRKSLPQRLDSLG